MRNIVLVGFMGSGKTTVGKLIAEKTGMTLLDMDSIIADRAGKTINDALLEVREAVDFCRYYAVRAQTEFAAADVLGGPTV